MTSRPRPGRMIAGRHVHNDPEVNARIRDALSAHHERESQHAATVVAAMMLPYILPWMALAMLWRQGRSPTI